MKFPLTDQLIDEARRFELRSACRDCFFWRKRGAEGRKRGAEGRKRGAEGRKRGAEGRDDDYACAHDWPDDGQRRWPIDAPNEDGTRPAEAAFCKEFELA